MIICIHIYKYSIVLFERRCSYDKAFIRSYGLRTYVYLDDNRVAKTVGDILLLKKLLIVKTRYVHSSTNFKRNDRFIGRIQYK